VEKLMNEYFQENRHSTSCSNISDETPELIQSRIWVGSEYPLCKLAWESEIESIEIRIVHDKVIFISAEKQHY